MLRVAGKHPNVVTLRAFFEDKDAYYIVMELCKGGELYRHLADKVRTCQVWGWLGRRLNSGASGICGSYRFL